jgi:hypothetical protein
LQPSRGVTGSSDKTARLWDLSAKDPAANPPTDSPTWPSGVERQGIGGAMKKGAILVGYDRVSKADDQDTAAQIVNKNSISEALGSGVSARA